MSEWVSVLAVFWVLWALDGARLGPRRGFTLRGGGLGGWAGRGSRTWVRMVFSRLSLPGWSPGGWRMTAADVPLVLSPAGICNRPAGAMGRPGENLPVVQAWRWAEVREVGVAGGWIFVNGARFCPDTGHVTAPALLALARAAPEEREGRIRALLGRWFRPEQLRRRGRVLVGRTRWPAWLNAATLAGYAAITGYVAGDVPARIPLAWSERGVAAAPWILLALFLVHFAAVVMAWRGLRRLRAVRPEKRGANFLSALLLPPQALRLRTLAGEGFFPAQHPLAAVVAFDGEEGCARWGFNVLADLRWPIGTAPDTPLAREIGAWYSAALEQKVVAVLTAVGCAPDVWLAPPAPDGAASCQYCPRCRDQFGAGPTVCPNGIALRPLSRPGGPRHGP